MHLKWALAIYEIWSNLLGNINFQFVAFLKYCYTIDDCLCAGYCANCLKECLVYDTIEHNIFSPEFGDNFYQDFYLCITIFKFFKWNNEWKNKKNEWINEWMNEWINEMNEIPICDSSLLLDCVI